MRVSVYLACAAALACARADDAGVAAAAGLLEPVAVQADRETVDYLLPRLAAKYRPAGDWSGVTDPRFYLLTEMENNEAAEGEEHKHRKVRNKRYNNGQSQSTLSVQAPIQVLRNMYDRELFRQRMLQNRRILENIV